MRRIGFLGLGKMGLPMAQNLVRAGFTVTGYDPDPARCTELAGSGGNVGALRQDAIRGADAVVCVLPGGDGHRDIFLAPDGVLAACVPGQLVIDSSTTSVAAARAITEAGAAGRVDVVDAPISGGVRGAAAASLTFMVGGTAAAFARARPVLAGMGNAFVHTGDAGTGQAAKLCNNLIAGITTIAVCEAFALAEGLGLDPAAFFEIAKTSSAQSWIMANLCPIPGLVPGSPASNGYRPGGASEMLLKDLQLAQDAARLAGVGTPLGAATAALYQIFCANGNGALDSSAIIKLIRGN